ncbi:hypothetical protein NDU88_007714 [Pleurodeles waltl]|uniref:Uncharacterized protein n=1 Tax=Pleurodeles waltl TaxID=8319 RepID=A0AAV7U1Y1_PLEWA|nr:hypothetical protein NDU88_007714 [Pleurodeles waltl]
MTSPLARAEVPHRTRRPGPEVNQARGLQNSCLCQGVNIYSLGALEMLHQLQLPMGTHCPGLVDPVQRRSWQYWGRAGAEHEGLRQTLGISGIELEQSQPGYSRVNVKHPKAGAYWRICAHWYINESLFVYWYLVVVQESVM